MHKLIAVSLFAAIVAAPALAPALANDAEDQCNAYVAENGGDPSGCACIGEQADADPGFAEAISRIDSQEALDAADQSTKDKIAICYPNSAS